VLACEKFSLFAKVLIVLLGLMLMQSAEAKRKVLLFHPRTFHEKNYRNHWIPYSVLSLASFLPTEKLTSNYRWS